MSIRNYVPCEEPRAPSTGKQQWRPQGYPHMRNTLNIGDQGSERIILHSLSHTAVSIAVTSGATVKAIQTFLGHESAAMTLDTYAGLFDKDLDIVSDAMSERTAKCLLLKRESAHQLGTGRLTLLPSDLRLCTCARADSNCRHPL